MQNGMSQTEVLGFATELYAAVYAVARRHGMTFDQVIDILVRTRHLKATRTAA